MKVQTVGENPTTVEVEEQDGKLIAKDGTEYELLHTSGIFKFVQKVEKIVDEVEAEEDKIEDEVESQIENAEDAVASELPAEEVPAEDNGGGGGGGKGQVES